MRFLNGASPRIISVSSINITKETQTIRARSTINQLRKWLVRRWLALYPNYLEVTTNMMEKRIRIPPKNLQPMLIRRCDSGVSWINPSKDECAHHSLWGISTPSHLRGERIQDTVIGKHLQMVQRLSKQSLEHDYLKCDVKRDWWEWWRWRGIKNLYLITCEYGCCG